MRAHLDMSKISVIAAQTGVTAMGNFRVSGMALGRQSCPLLWTVLQTRHSEDNGWGDFW
jgi:hypothetical protein